MFEAIITLCCLLVLFLAFIFTRAIMFKPKDSTEKIETDTDFDKERAVSCLASLVKCKTVSYNDTSLEDDEEFEKLIKSLKRLYPAVSKNCELTRINKRAILFHWKGKSEGEASVLMAHFDVVPVDEGAWDKPCFDAIIEDGCMWGRGTLDTKATLNGALFGADTLIEKGFVPEHDVYFAFSGNEETNGDGATSIIDYFEENNIKIGLVLDEGGAVVENVFPGVKSPCAVIGIAEKGMLNLEYKVKANGGHASSPMPRSSIGILSDACSKIENHPFKMHMCDPVRQLFDTLGRHSTFLYRVIFSNLWAFKGILNMLGKKKGGEMNALLRTTVAFTQMKGSPAMNVLPTEATMVSNLRLNPHDTIDSAISRIKNVIDDERVEISVLNGFNPSRISRTDCAEFDKIKKAVSSTWDCIVTPYLMVQCSDSRHYGRISDRVYRFSAMDMTKEERASVHGNNERIRIDTIHKSCEFYINVIKQL